MHSTGFRVDLCVDIRMIWDADVRVVNPCRIVLLALECLELHAEGRVSSLPRESNALVR